MQNSDTACTTTIDKVVSLHKRLIQHSYLRRGQPFWTSLPNFLEFDRIAILLATVISVLLFVPPYETMRGLIPGQHVNFLLLGVCFASTGLMFSRLQMKGIRNRTVQVSLVLAVLLSMALTGLLHHTIRAAPFSYPLLPCAITTDSNTDGPATTAAIASSILSLLPLATNLTTPLSPHDYPLIDLGASLRTGTALLALESGARMTKDNPTDAAQAASALLDITEAQHHSLQKFETILLFVTGVLLMGIGSAILHAAFDFARCIIILVRQSATTQGTKARLARSLSKVLVYGLWVAAWSWFRPLFADQLLDPLAARCEPNSVSRDCVFSSSVATSADLAGEHESTLFGMLLAPFLAPLKLGGRLSETTWLRIRFLLVIALAALMLYLFRSLLGAFLHTGEGHLRTVLEKYLKNLREHVNSSNARSKDLKKARKDAKQGDIVEDENATLQATEFLVQATAKEAVTGAANSWGLLFTVGTSLLALPTFLLSLTFLALRLGEVRLGLSGYFRSILPASVVPVAASTEDGDSFSKLLRLVGNWANLSTTVHSVTHRTVVDEIVHYFRTVVLSPFFWRPYLSFLVFATVVLIVISLQLGLFYYGFVAPSIIPTRNTTRREEAKTSDSEHSTATIKAD